ncbi:MaoC family dehydratase N-terminal domain-containing protein [Aestuariimicrobium sp. p3-SID1156]|uniref:MaoC/PaaZ C-terminal domain-containing protein n=1 Tax=Aestuariimicrobium sp. p3-SID1156 TaxID=2916038 RepID=UPI00223AB3AA|nr:MaoC/PaaZ C-terminal domain-containing protein [Aestuariimicrobium sp. p3-SID1156]MCT1458805.1 MaoC family dehydratase N-terminal domain-containing protein [Aestuariimicrobium sp. p3-SID1156]
MSHRTVEVGEQLPDREVRITRADVVRYAGASTDLNPIHWSDRHARAIGLDGCIAHGMWTMGAALSQVIEWAGGPEHIAEYFVRFTRPVPVPDDDEGTLITFSAQVSDVSEGIATVSIEALCQDQKVLGAAKAQVRL